MFGPEDIFLEDYSLNQLGILKERIAKAEAKIIAENEIDAICRAINLDKNKLDRMLEDEIAVVCFLGRAHTNQYIDVIMISKLGDTLLVRTRLNSCFSLTEWGKSAAQNRYSVLTQQVIKKPNTYGTATSLRS